MINKTVLRPIVIYGNDAWTLTDREERWLKQWGRKIVRRILVPGGKETDGEYVKMKSWREFWGN